MVLAIWAGLHGSLGSAGKFFRGLLFLALEGEGRGEGFRGGDLGEEMGDVEAGLLEGGRGVGCLGKGSEERGVVGEGDSDLFLDREGACEYHRHDDGV